MSQSIIPIDLGGVNCYLLPAGEGFILVDTGIAAERADLEKVLEKAGCRPGNLRLILITHGDIDHVDNGAYLQAKYGAPVAMHALDAGMVEHGDMGWNRKPKPDQIKPLFGLMMLLMRWFGPRPSQFQTFKPDRLVEDGQDLAEYGCAAKVLHLPGHSQGSIGVLTDDGGLICGDLFYNMPGFGFVDDLAQHHASLDRLKSLPVRRVYPGHGRPCPVSQVIPG